MLRGARSRGLRGRGGRVGGGDGRGPFAVGWALREVIGRWGWGHGRVRFDYRQFTRRFRTLF